MAALDTPLTLDELARATDRDPGSLRADLTVLELRRAVRRAGSKFERAEGSSA